jgi:hypothetical protein
MRITATRTTATLTGIWTVLGMRFLVLPLLSPRTPRLSGLLFVAFGFVVFLVPCKLFVEGFDSRRWGWRYFFSRDYWREAPHVVVRTMFWFLGVVAAAAVLSLIEER